MKTITKYVTLDVVEHASSSDAKRHLDKLYADIICKTAAQMRDLGYVEFTEYINVNLQRFIDLQAIKDDMLLQNDDAEE